MSETVRLTAWSHGAGCACKLSLDELTEVLAGIDLGADDRLVVGTDSGDDAAVWRQQDGRLLVATTDFFTPIVDDPATWGRIAATNAVSDVYAMGALPRFALNLVGWPRELDFSLLRAVLNGASQVAGAAGYPIVGGHTIDAAEPLYGQVVIGEVGADELLTNAGARVGQAVVLTKPIGTGIVTTALKRLPTDAGSARAPLTRAYDAAVAVMLQRNDVAAAAARTAGATAATDVTGFGLLGHAHRLAAASEVALRLDPARVPVIPGARELLAEGHLPGGTARNRAQAARYLSNAPADAELDLLADAQTSGGLLFTCAPASAEAAVKALCDQGHRAAVIGHVVDGTTGTLELAPLERLLG